MKSVLNILILTFGLVNYKVSAQGVGAGADGGVSGGLDEAGASGSVSGSASIDCHPISDDLPSCACLSGSISGSAEESNGVGTGGSASVHVEPGVNCIDDADVEGDESDGFTTYQIDVERNSMMITANYYIKLENVVRADANITYMKAITKEEPLKIYMAQIMNTKTYKEAWKWKEDKSMKNACDDSFAEGTVEYIIFDILNKMIYNEQGCNVDKGSVFIMVPWLRSYEMKFNGPISCGSYSLDIWLNTPTGSSAGRFWFDWTIPEGSNCLPDFQKIE